LRVLQQQPNRPMDLEQKALHLCVKLIELVGLAKGKEAEKLAYGQLISGKARAMMQKIIKTQNGNPDVYSEKLKLAKIQYDIHAEKNGKVQHIDMKVLNTVARTLGAPLDLKAGLYLHKKLWEVVKKGETIYTLYASDETKIKLAKEILDKQKMYKID